MKKFLIVISILISYLFVKDWLDDRPFKFERYNNREELNTALQKQFPARFRYARNDETI